MHVSESWLRTFINPPLSLEQIAEKLTQAGLEVEGIETFEKGEKVLVLKIPPNRGDCLGVEGIARELAAITEQSFQPIKIGEVAAEIQTSFPIELLAPNACPQYFGRIIQGVNADAKTPPWLTERLTAAGIRNISPVVDVTNYVMLELGQPMHAFDFAGLDSGLEIRLAKSQEKILTLDEKEVDLSDNTLIIADKNGPLAIAGVIGGLNSSVQTATRDIFLESAYFDPIQVRLASNQYRIRTDSSYRFERGVDPQLQKRALERATQLLMEIVGGKPGKILEKSDVTQLPIPPMLHLRKEKVNSLLGVAIDDNTLVALLQRLGMKVLEAQDHLSWQVTPPSYRSDILLEVDLIEEVARLFGYHRIAAQALRLPLESLPLPEKQTPEDSFKQVLINRGYAEIKSYSFVEAEMNQRFNPDQPYLSLENPLSKEMAAMRTSLWPGLIKAATFNQARQQGNLRLFEIGPRYIPEAGNCLEEKMIAGLISGTLSNDHWKGDKRPIDFFDVKKDIEAMIRLSQNAEDFSFEACQHPVLHPGQTAGIYYQARCLGQLGVLHPGLEKMCELTGPVILFEIEFLPLQDHTVTQFRPVSKYPSVRRDIAILVDARLPVAELRHSIQTTGGELIKNVYVFDVYQGKGIPSARKSVALGILLQHSSRTLVEEEVNAVIAKIVEKLKKDYQVVLRE